MGYLNESGLARYDGLIKSWTTYDSGTVTGLAPLLNWQKTADAASVTCYPVPVSPLEPNVSFMFTETPPLDGNPKSPTNPSTIAGVSSITVTRCETAGVDETDYAIALGDTYYGGSLDVASGTLTVTKVAVVFGATALNWTRNTNFGTVTNFYSTSSLYPGRVNVSSAVCSHFSVVSSSADTVGFGLYSSNNGGFFHYPGANQSVDTFNSFLAGQYSAGTPVTVVYQIATPYTVQLTPTQIYSLSQSDEYTPRLNTVYSDQQSVQVGYAKSPIQTESELTNAIISLGGNV